MLLLARREKERIVINKDIVVTVMEIVGNKVVIGVDAPRSVEILRDDIVDPEVQLPEVPMKNPKKLKLRQS